MIPRLIIQTGPPNIPLLLQSAIVNVKLLHPAFQYRFYDDKMIDEFLKEHFPEYIADYNSFRFRIQRYDFFRYLAIYKFGGFYFDLDVFLVRDVTPLLEYDCVFSFEELAAGQYFWKHHQMDWQIGNFAFGAEPGHPFLGAAIRNCLRAKSTPNWVTPMMEGIPRILMDDAYVLNTTGPGMLSRTLAENPELAGDIKILFPNDVCDRDSWHQFGNFGVHHMAGSWRVGSGLFGRLLARHWKERIFRRVLADGRTRGKTRTVRSLSKRDSLLHSK